MTTSPDWLRADLLLLAFAFSVVAAGLALMTVWGARLLVARAIKLWTALLDGAAKELR